MFGYEMNWHPMQQAFENRGYGRPCCGPGERGGRGGRGGEGRRGFGPGFGPGFGGPRGPQGFGRGRERMLDAGEMKLVLVKLLSEQPSYGYQLMKTMEEKLAGGYIPSAGAVYPTLTMLEEEGLAVSSAESAKKVYSLTEEGSRFLEANRSRVDEIFARLEETGRGFERGRSPEILRAFMDLRGAVMSRVSREGLSEERLRKIAEAIHAAARTIDSL